MVRFMMTAMSCRALSGIRRRRWPSRSPTLSKGKQPLARPGKNAAIRRAIMVAMGETM
jgi:hypothetical protein